MKSFKLLLLALLIVGCAPIRVSYDFEKTTNFSKYKTYQYYGDMKTGLSELDTKRLLDAIDSKMNALGIKVSETPDFLIDIKSAELHGAPGQTVGVGLGGGGGNVGGGISIGIPVGQSNVNRQITLDFVDEKGKGLFWQAISESSFNPSATPESREARLKSIVEKILTNYPPKN
ncbi:DUF4136 domain-containing protein [Seonamhaeicola maritimus]|uniref:DUF4136 domain-containing protein n=1 Tax=Seonamhaeicola maritimus TaxID=2591822 RepID=A0A5C7GDR3_9FLAO|nr:DUF4136 domain-containing protein [Seonamhaeicola maritimus]TXG34561.1 DUF4136 domain-containing protein [Seonamhaeicola maritimus]